MTRFTYDHIHLRSPDPEATARWYERMLGAEVIRSMQQGKPRIDLKLGGANIFLAPVTPGDGVNPPPTTPYQGLDHFGLCVSGIDAVVAELKGKGVEFTKEPTTVRPGVRVAFLRAPEGVSISFSIATWLERIVGRHHMSANQDRHAMQEKKFEVTHTDAEWRRLLTPEQYQVMRHHGTERAGSCALNYEKRAGTFYCAGCGQRLFESKKKFESGTGWPSFNDPVPGSVETSTDRSYGMVRTEVHCSRCGSHLGHVFEDGPPPTHLRYCINGVAMNFEPASPQ